MVTHIVIFTWTAGATVEQIARVAPGLDELRSEVAAIGSLRHGPDLRFREGNGDYALVATFEDQAAWLAYQADEQHKTFVRDVVGPIQASRLTIQF